MRFQTGVTKFQIHFANLRQERSIVANGLLTVSQAKKYRVADARKSSEMNGLSCSACKKKGNPSTVE